jgi:hypothetical protein
MVELEKIAVTLKRKASGSILLSAACLQLMVWLQLGKERIMRYDQEQTVSRIGEKGYLDLVAIFFSIGFKNINDVPDDLWNVAVHSYEEQLFRRSA